MSMKTPLVFLSLLALGSSCAAQAIIVGGDADQDPNGPTPSLDGALPLVVVDYQQNVHENTTAVEEMFSVGLFRFYAQGDGDVTPFVALLDPGFGAVATDYDIVAIGQRFKQYLTGKS